MLQVAELGGGPWRGVRWPVDLLTAAGRGRIAGLECPVISPRAQVEIKRMMPEWVPGMPRRPKDAEDITRLLQRLAE